MGKKKGKKIIMGVDGENPQLPIRDGDLIILRDGDAD